MVFLSSGALVLHLPRRPHPFSVPGVPLTRPEQPGRSTRANSDISFRIRHFVSRVRGTFHVWSGTIRSDSADWRDGSVDVTIQASSIDTQNDRRDADLKSEDFFEVTRFPTINIRSNSVAVEGTTLRITGDLTIHGVTRRVVLEGSYDGTTSNPQGKPRAGFEVRATINRTEYGVTWNRVVEGGGVMLGDDVEIEISVEAVRQS